MNGVLLPVVLGGVRVCLYAFPGWGLETFMPRAHLEEVPRTDFLQEMTQGRKKAVSGQSTQAARRRAANSGLSEEARRGSGQP